MPMNMQQTGSSGARRILLVVLLALSIALMVVYAMEGEEGPVHSFQSSVMDVSGQAGGATAGLGSLGGATSVAVEDATASPSTLSALRQQNEELIQQLAASEEYRQEAERLRALLDMKQISGVTGPVARVIGRSSNAWDQSITIDLGSADGVRSGMTVMGSTGVIGQVSRTTEHTSTVRLLTDPNSGAAVMIQSSRKNGIVRGSINGVLYLEDLDEDVIPEEGDIVLTSGLGGSYERGLIVGLITSVEKTPANPTGAIIVNPNDRAMAVEEVIVVFTAPAAPTEDAEQASGDAEGEASADDGADLDAAANEYADYDDGTGYGEYAAGAGEQ